MRVDSILVNGNIRTMDPQNQVVRWVAIDQGKIFSIGILDGDMPQTDCPIDLAGRTVLPGFIDSHTHGTLTGISLLSIDFRETKSLDEVFEKLESEMQKYA
jgi:predicted amidohydrolase YtcJ